MDVIDNNIEIDSLKRKPSSEKDLMIIQFNCNGLYNKLLEFKVYIYSTKPDIFCLCETYVKPSHEPIFKGYASFWKHREGHKGGLGIFVRRDIKATKKNLQMYNPGKLEIQCIEICNSKRKINIMNLYNPNQDITFEELEYYRKQIIPNFITVGDFNGHSPMWDKRGRSNATGKAIELFLSSSNLRILNDILQPTYLDFKYSTTSCLDLCISTQGLSKRCSLEIGKDLGSDHFPIICNFGINYEKELEYGKPSWRYNRADWDMFQEILEKSNSDGALISEDVEFLNENLTSLIKSAAMTSMGKTTGRRNLNRYVPGWDTECNELVSHRRKLKNKLLKAPTCENYIQWKMTRAKCRQLIKQKKKESFHNFVNSINCNTPSKEVWNKIKSLNGGKNKSPYSFGDNAKSNEQTADEFLEHFTRFKQPEDDNIGDITTIIEELTLNEQEIPSITERELEYAIQRLKNTSPGEDQISNTILKHVPNCMKELLIRLFNMSFKHSQVPNSWKIGITCPILKPYKDPTIIKSCRPITMLSCIGKLMERIVQRRLEYYIEINNKLDNRQYGFRRGTGTTEALAAIHSSIAEALEQKEYAITTYLDLQSAFDTVWHKAVLYKAYNMQIPEYLLKWLNNYFENRNTKVSYKNYTTTQKRVEVGVPQGAVLSPLLFNIMLSDLPHSDNVKVVTYADDITLITRGKTLSEARDHMQIYLKCLGKWFKNWKMNINPQKSVFQIFTRKRNIPNITLRVYNHNLQLVNEQRVLGIMFDSPKLTFTKHISYLQLECQKRLNILRVLSSTRWGCSRTLLRKVYTSYIQSKMEYGSILLVNISQPLMEKLEKIQNAAMRSILGARKTSPICSMQVETFLPPLRLKLRLNFLKWSIKTKGHHFLRGEIFGNKDNPNKIYQRIFTEISYFMQMKNQRIESSNPIPKIEPWIDIEKSISIEMPLTASIAHESINKRFSDYIQRNYEKHIEIYTDGSKLSSGSASAAVYIPELNRKVITFKLNADHSILGCELYAISKALELVEILNSNKQYIIITDSQSALSAIKNTTKISYQTLIEPIQMSIRRNLNVKLQWTPSHCGIIGNDIADKAAKLGHSNEVSTLSFLSQEEHSYRLHGYFRRYWNLCWGSTVICTQKGKFMFDLRKTIENTFWLSHESKRIETIVSRLRIGHVGVKNHLSRFNMSDTEKCARCDQPETIEHFLIDCTVYSTQRQKFKSELAELKVAFTLRNVLCFGNQSTADLQKILGALAEFIRGSGRMAEL